MESSKPITPNEVKKELEESMPSFIFDVVNKLIVEKTAKNITISCTIKQDDIIKELMKNQYVIDNNIKKGDIFDKGWLNIESHYIKAGWVVKYDKPAYNENYDAYFEFSIK